ncbi:HEPN domain-containing protein [Aliikangiella coralliicola]|uniref:HEPN domain-containing protein n=1 Tax=Aliikangiella coralliicola TaxID=2592383 RepID=A0A545UDP3_9GAMM|nr:HEPN domain-containing protein [Aliikangiella coralliicola]TQV87569.1 HEPN domain-containing protein [Aliikangiella coralliicola]
MKTSIDHLPENKQSQLKSAVEIVRKYTDPEMIILFGSYARGEWVDDLDEETMNYRYQSDFDLLVITETAKQAEKVEENGHMNQSLRSRIRKTPISIIAESIESVNSNLRKQQYFFSDIKREGILLFDSGRLKLDEPAEIDDVLRKKLAQEDLDFWFNNANEFLINFNAALKRKSFNIAAFELHQATENLLATNLLVFTHYKPSTHDIEKLYSLVNSLHNEFITAFPLTTDKEQKLFKLLRRAYVNARYNKTYTINQEQLEWLAECVERLKELTKKLCREKIERF